MNIFIALTLVTVSSYSLAKFPVRVPGITIKNSQCDLQETATTIESLKKDTLEIIKTLFPPLPQETCNCSTLIDRTRNVSCITACCGEGRLIYDANLTSGNLFIAQGLGLTQTHSLYDPSARQNCDLQGVLRIDFRSACNDVQNCKLRFDFYFQFIHAGFNFDIGDSTNNGYGGDAGDTSNAAEVHNVGESFLVYSNNLPGYGDYANSRTLLVDQVRNVVTDHFTVTIGNEFVMFDNNNGVQRSYRSRYLFTLNGQSTTYGSVDYLLSLSMNRVITSNFRSGTGLCRAVIRTLDC